MIFVSLENWDEIWRRNQFLCATLARRYPQHRILFVEPAEPLRRPWRRVGEPWKAEPFETLFVTRPPKVVPECWPGGGILNRMAFARHIQQAAAALSFNQPLLWLNPHSAYHLPGRCGESAVVYDITDDWSLASFPPREASRIVSQDRALCARADLVVVCSEALQNSRAPVCRRLLLLPNGVDAAHYASVSSMNVNVSRPVFGYTGTLHRDRIDVSIIVALSKAFPEGRVVLIGPDHLDAASRGALQALPNVCLGGPVPYARIPEEMALFNVCIVPHRETSFTESLNPIKLWEYLACGKPIVSTNIAGFREYSHLCHVVSGSAAFVEACRVALSDGMAGCEARKSVAVQNSWESRVDNLLESIHAARLLA